VHLLVFLLNNQFLRLCIDQHNRKNWLFAGSPNGADASAFIYSLIESAKANNLEPKRYLKELFERYPLAGSDEERKRLLPWNFECSS
jgi:transposase